MKPTLRQIEEREKQKKEKRQIDTLIKYDRAKICPKCGELMRYAFGEVFKCDNCGAEEMTSFGKVRKYIEDHGPSNAANISDGTGVPVSTINRYLREGRIEIPDGSDSYIKCEDCGAEIRYGRFCPECSAKLSRDNSSMVYVGEKPKHKMDYNGKMHTLDESEMKNVSRKPVAMRRKDKK
jgi:predicted amidophosphoribosyltransferase